MPTFRDGVLSSVSLEPRAVVGGVQPQGLRKRFSRRHQLTLAHQRARLLQPGRHHQRIVLQGLFVQRLRLRPVVLPKNGVARIEGLRGGGLGVEFVHVWLPLSLYLRQ